MAVAFAIRDRRKAQKQNGDSANGFNDPFGNEDSEEINESSGLLANESR